MKKLFFLFAVWLCHFDTIGFTIPRLVDCQSIGRLVNQGDGYTLSHRTMKIQKHK